MSDEARRALGANGSVRVAALLAAVVIAGCGRTTLSLVPNDRGDAGASAGGASACCTDRSLGALPPELVSLVWPALPVIAEEVDVETNAQLDRALDRPSTRVRVHGSHHGVFVISRSDVEIVLDDDAYVESLAIVRSQHRIRIRGGTLASIEMLPPLEYGSGSATVNEALMVTDLTIECVTMSASDSAIVVRGHRVAVVGSDVSAVRYALFAGDTDPVPIRDVIVAHSVLRSAGPETTCSLHGVERGVVAHTTLTNTYEQNWRLAGVASHVYLGDSVLVGTGAMIGSDDPSDAVDGVFFVRNTVYYDGSNGIIVVDPETTSRLTVTDNVAFSDMAFDPSVWRAGWDFERNATRPYTPPPASVLALDCR